MGRWAKSHDQRKGQWLFNKIMEVHSDYTHDGPVAKYLFNMSNEEFEKIMGDYPK